MALKKYNQLYFENTDVTKENYVQIINEKNFDRLITLIKKDNIFYGGKSDRSVRFIEPTILTNISFSDDIMKDEIFGPILPVIPFENLNDAILKVKSLPKPLSCYLFTRNNDKKQKILNEISFGGGCINDTVMHITNSNLPFGGIGNSGVGAYHHESGFIAFSHYKSILEKPYNIEFPIKYIPYSNRKLRIIKWLIG